MRVVVGVNEYQEDEEEARIEQPAFPELEARQRDRLSDCRSARDAGAVERSLTALGEAATGTDNLVPYMVEAVKVRTTLGEISDALRRIWGEYRVAS